MSSLDKALDDVIKDNRRNNRQSGRSDQKSRRQQSSFGSSSGGGIRKRTTGPRNTRNGGGSGGGPIGSKIIRTVNVRNPTGGSRFVSKALHQTMISIKKKVTSVTIMMN